MKAVNEIIIALFSLIGTDAQETDALQRDYLTTLEPGERESLYAMGGSVAKQAREVQRKLDKACRFTVSYDGVQATITTHSGGKGKPRLDHNETGARDFGQRHDASVQAAAMAALVRMGSILAQGNAAPQNEVVFSSLDFVNVSVTAEHSPEDEAA